MATASSVKPASCTTSRLMSAHQLIAVEVGAAFDHPGPQPQLAGGWRGVGTDHLVADARRQRRQHCGDLHVVQGLAVVELPRQFVQGRQRDHLAHFRAGLQQTMSQADTIQLVAGEPSSAPGTRRTPRRSLADPPRTDLQQTGRPSANSSSKACQGSKFSTTTKGAVPPRC